MLTQIESACQDIITPQMSQWPITNLDAGYIQHMASEGKIVTPWNHGRKPNAVGIGKGISSKVNPSIGTSSDIVYYEVEVRKTLLSPAASGPT